MHPLRSRVGWGVPGRRRDVSTTKSPTGSPTLSWKTAVSTSGNTARRRAFRVGRGGGADRTQCRSIRAVRDPPRAIRADRTQFQGTSPVQDGRYGDDERTRRRGQSLLRNGGNSAPTEPNTEVFEPAATVDTAAPTEPNVEAQVPSGTAEVFAPTEPNAIVEPDEVKTKAQPSAGRKKVWTYTAVELVETTVRRRGGHGGRPEFQVAASWSPWESSAGRDGCWSWATEPLGFGPGSRAWGYAPRRGSCAGLIFGNVVPRR